MFYEIWFQSRKGIALVFPLIQSFFVWCVCSIAAPCSSSRACLVISSQITSDNATGSPTRPCRLDGRCRVPNCPRDSDRPWRSGSWDGISKKEAVAAQLVRSCIQRARVEERSEDRMGLAAADCSPVPPLAIPPSHRPSILTGRRPWSC